MTKILETDRLILRHWTFEDADAVFEICRNAEVMLHIGDGKPYQTVEQAREFLNWAVLYQSDNGFCRWAVVEKASGKIVGSCGFARRKMQEIELGYLFARNVWGKGYATEAASACLKHYFERISSETIIAITDIDHKNSQNVLTKIGFTPRGIEKTVDGEDMIFEFSPSS